MEKFKEFSDGWFCFQINDKQSIAFNETETAYYNEGYKESLLNHVEDEEEIAKMVFAMGLYIKELLSQIESKGVK